MRNRIKETRVAKKMTQGELASKSGLTRPYISKLENNETYRSSNGTELLPIYSSDEWWHGKKYFRGYVF